MGEVATLPPDGEQGGPVAADLVRGGAAGGGGAPPPPVPSPWRLAGHDLVRNKSAMASFAVLVLIVLACLAAPLYASHIAHTDPFTSNIEGTTVVNGQTVKLIQQSTQGLGLGSLPIGPTWDPGHYFLGADVQGRDVMARILYGGRNTIFIGLTSAVLICFFATIIGLVAGFFGGWIDYVISRVLDVLWAFPVYLFAISLSVVLLTSGFAIGPVHIGAGSLAVPILIITVIFIAYVARPVRGEVLTLREREFVQAGIGVGASDWRLIRRDILPNVLTTVIVFIPLMAAIAMLTESALSFLSIGVQPPNASWGTIINDGQSLLYSRPAVAIVPGVLIAVTALCLNLLGDGVRDALDPSARLRGGA